MSRAFHIPSIGRIVKESAAKHGIEPALVLALIERESGFEAAAVRYEPLYRWLFFEDKVRPAGCSYDTERALQRTSWGLMQVMGAVLRELGYRGWLTAIAADPARQVDYGCRHFAAQLKRYKGDAESAIAAYNAGSARRKSGGKWVNQEYVEGVLGLAEKYRGFEL